MDGNETATPAAMVDQLLTEITPRPRQRPRIHVKGFGTLILRGTVWHVRYTFRGRRRERSSKSTDEDIAREFLRRCIEDDSKKNRRETVREDKVRMEALFTALEDDYTNNARRSLKTLRFRLKALRQEFGPDKAVDVTPSRIQAYVTQRRHAGVARATVNRELAALRRAFTLAREDGKITAVPHVRLMAEHNARQGFVTATEFETIMAHLPPYLTDLVRFAFTIGWRKGEILTLKWSDVDRERQQITLRREHSKNEEPRVVPLVGELAEIIERRWAARGTSGHVFHRAGRPIRDFDVAWENACTAAGKPALLFHDLRRSAVRNLVSSGVDESVAMKITGHKTNSVFKRYRIVAVEDMRAALTRTEAAIRSAKPVG